MQATLLSQPVQMINVIKALRVTTAAVNAPVDQSKSLVWLSCHKHIFWRGHGVEHRKKIGFCF